MGQYLSYQSEQPEEEQTYQKVPRKYGWRRDKPDFRDYKKDIVEFEHYNEALIDMRNKCPEIYDQGHLGSCTANAIAGAYEFNMIKENETKIFVPSRLFIYYNERKMEGSVDTDSGAEIRDGIKSVNRQGIVPEQDWPYDISQFTVEPPQKLYKEAQNHKAVKYERVHQDINHIKQVVHDGEPVVFGFAVYESFQSEETATTGKMVMPKKDEELLGGHAVMVVGYDDKEEVMIVRNSWGTEWGDKGYFYMPYDYIKNPDLCSDFWIIKRVEDNI